MSDLPGERARARGEPARGRIIGGWLADLAQFSRFMLRRPPPSWTWSAAGWDGPLSS
jgi:hypothetical protein